MIHIIQVNALCEDITNEMLNYIGRHIPNNEYKFICEIDDNNGNIYVMPHFGSLLREYFIKPFIDTDGFIDKSVLGKLLEVELNGRKFKYTITMHEDFYKYEKIKDYICQ